MKDLYAVRDNNVWKVFGNTFDSKDALKREGAAWHPGTKTWDFHSEMLPPYVSRMVTVLVDATDVDEIAKAIREAGASPNSGEPQTIIKEVEIEVEKIVEKRVPVNNARYTRLNSLSSKRTKARKTVHSRIEVEPKNQMVKPSYWPELVDYLRPAECRPVTALVGPAGNGKTTVAKAVMDAHSYAYVEIDGTEFIEPQDLIGGTFIKAENGGTSSIWVDGPVTKAFKEGLGVVLNEYDALNPRAALCLQSVFQEAGRDKQGRYVTTVGCPEHDRVYPKGDCPIILSLNTYGTGSNRQYVGRNTMDAASIDRLTIITTGYENEAAIIQSHGYSKVTGEKLEKWANEVRGVIEGNTLKVILSNRTLLRMAQAIEIYGWNWRKTVEKEFLGRFESSVRNVLESKAYVEPVVRERRPKTFTPPPPAAIKPPQKLDELESIGPADSVAGGDFDDLPAAMKKQIEDMSKALGTPPKQRLTQPRKPRNPNPLPQPTPEPTKEPDPVGDIPF